MKPWPTKAPSRLAPHVDRGDHVHPSAAGYAFMADAIDLSLLTAELPPTPEPEAK